MDIIAVLIDCSIKQHDSYVRAGISELVILKFCTSSIL